MVGRELPFAPPPRDPCVAATGGCGLARIPKTTMHLDMQIVPTLLIQHTKTLALHQVLGRWQFQELGR